MGPVYSFDLVVLRLAGFVAGAVTSGMAGGFDGARVRFRGAGVVSGDLASARVFVWAVVWVLLFGVALRAAGFVAALEVAGLGADVLATGLGFGSVFGCVSATDVDATLVLGFGAVLRVAGLVGASTGVTAFLATVLGFAAGVTRFAAGFVGTFADVLLACWTFGDGLRSDTKPKGFVSGLGSEKGLLSISVRLMA